MTSNLFIAIVENCATYLTCIQRPRRMWPRRNFAKMLSTAELEWLGPGYNVLKKVWRYVSMFRYNTRTWQTDGRTDRTAVSISRVSTVVLYLKKIRHKIKKKKTNKKLGCRRGRATLRVVDILLSLKVAQDHSKLHRGVGHVYVPISISL